MQELFKLSPYIRLAGMQGNDEWPTINRRIYDYQFFYCIQGKGTITLDGVTHDIEEGSLFLIRPNVPHKYARDANNPCECFWFHMDPFARSDYQWPTTYYETADLYVRLFAPILQYTEHIRETVNVESDYRIPDVMVVSDKEYMAKQFRTIYEAYLSHKETWHFKANSAFYNILDEIYTDNESNTTPVSRANYQVNQMQNFIKNNYFRKINTKEICSQGIYSADYAGKIFKEVTGQNVSEYLQDYRLTKAKQLFLSMELSISDIAYMCGFNSDSYFSAVVKKKEGMSPTKLRRQILEKVNMEDEIK